MTSRLVSGRLEATSVSAAPDYKLLMPADADPSVPLPLILHLHGAMSSAASLEAARPAYEQAWARGSLPPALIGCISAPTVDGFYIDYADGPRWETLVGTEFPRHLAAQYALMDKRAALGFSMGGYGALKLAFRNPRDYTAVAALCPVIFPAESAKDVPEHNRPSMLDQLNRAMGGDDATYRRNSVYGILRENAQEIRAADVRLFFDCGDADEFNLHDGALYLHTLLNDLDVRHTFHSVRGAGHADAQAPARQQAAIEFVGRALRVAVTD